MILASSWYSAMFVDLTVCAVVVLAFRFILQVRKYFFLSEGLYHVQIEHYFSLKKHVCDYYVDFNYFSSTLVRFIVTPPKEGFS